MRRYTHRCLPVLLLTAMIATLAHGGSAPGEGADSSGPTILFGTVLETLSRSDSTAGSHRPRGVAYDGVDSAGPAGIAPRLERYLQRAAAFRSRLPAASDQQIGTEQNPPASESGPAFWILEKRKSLERDLFAFNEFDGIAEEAAHYAAQAVLFYEWEGLPESPLGEAEYAEQFLLEHPETPWRPYLHLFLAHRYECAREILHLDGNVDAEQHASEERDRYIRSALGDPDPLIRFVAADLDRQPFFYLPPAEFRPDAPDSTPTARDLGTAPALSLMRALEIGETYLARERIDLTGQYLHSISLRYDERARLLYWHLQWMWAQPRLGGEFGLRVTMNGDVIPAPLGP
ncbi:MAG: hypothetical protein V1774_11580 [Candidatus Eisenbacteria bacterium]